MYKPCVILRAPNYEPIDWELCGNDRPCLTTENAKKLLEYLKAVERYHNHINEVCK